MRTLICFSEVFCLLIGLWLYTIFVESKRLESVEYADYKRLVVFSASADKSMVILIFGMWAMRSPPTSYF